MILKEKEVFNGIKQTSEEAIKLPEEYLNNLCKFAVDKNLKSKSLKNDKFLENPVVLKGMKLRI